MHLSGRWLASLGRFCIPVVVAVLSGCGDKFDTIQPPGAVVTKPTSGQAEMPAGQAEMPAVNLDKTRKLFSLAEKIEPGDKVGLFELRNEGMLIHPGELRPSRVSFRLGRNYRKLTARSFIAALQADAIEVKEAGTVGVEFLLDGKSMGRLSVNRDSPRIETLDLTNVDVLTVTVDNGNGKPWFDWLMFGVVELK